MDTQQREPESNASASNNQTEHVDHLMQLNEIRPAAKENDSQNVQQSQADNQQQNQTQNQQQNQAQMNERNDSVEQQLMLPPPDQNVTNFTINQATPTLLTDTETAAELSPNLQSRNRSDRSQAQNGTNRNQQAMAGTGTGLAWAGLISSLISLFVLPVFLGLVGIVLGFISIRGGSKTLGWWAIGIGAVSIVVSILFTPFVAR